MQRSLEVLTEELSMRRLLMHLIPRIVPGIPFACHEYRGKPDLLRKVGGRLRGYAALPDYFRVLVILDRDNDDCKELKKQVDDLAAGAGLMTSSVSRRRHGEVMTRIACEELEAWLLGDPCALSSAFPRIDASFATRARYRDPDAIAGGTAEALQDLLAAAGYQLGGLEKVSTADLVGPYMNIDHNSSTSFHQFVAGVRHLTEWSPR